jgi:uncharacterized oligopeptide transporter (OPT) family protein
VGLAFVVPASISIIMSAGALLAWLITAWRPRFASRFLLAAAAGMVAGEGVAGVLSSFFNMAGW